MKKYLTQGSVPKAILMLGWPIMVSMLVHLSYNIIDTIFVARLGANAVAAVTYCFPIIFIIFSLAQGLGIGTTALVAQFLGAGKTKEASNVAEHSIALAIILSLLITIPVLLLQKRIFALMGAPSQLLSLITLYSSLIFGAFSIVLITFVLNSVFRGIGEMKIPMRALVFSAIFNIILDPIMIFGLLGFPKLGITGAALATVISRLVALGYVIFILVKKELPIKLSLRYFRFKPVIIKKIISVGLPATLSTTLDALGSSVLMNIVSLFGAMAVAAWGIMIRLESILFMPMRGIGAATITLIGHNVGAGNKQRAKKVAFTAMAFVIAIVSLLGIVLYSYPEAFVRIFISERAVISFVKLYLSVMVFAYPFMAVLFIGISVLQGSGHLRPVLLSTIIKWAIILSASYLLKSSLAARPIIFFVLLAVAYIFVSLLVLVIIFLSRWLEPVVDKH